MYATLAYNLSAAAAGATNSDMTAVADPEFSQRNNHFIFTESYRMMAAIAVGASVTRGRFQVPTWNAIGEYAVFNANRALTPPSNPQWDSYYPLPPMVPVNEEFQIQMSNNLGAATEQENVIIQLMPDNWQQNMPSGSRLTITTRASFTLTPTINVWSNSGVLSFSQSLRGGTYAVIGAWVQGANAVAWRIVFPRSFLYHGRRMRPGGIVQTAIGDVTDQTLLMSHMYNGVLGLFHTFEPPTIDMLGATAAGTTYQVFFLLKYLGEDPQQNILTNWTTNGTISLAA